MQEHVGDSQERRREEMPKMPSQAEIAAQMASKDEAEKWPEPFSQKVEWPRVIYANYADVAPPEKPETTK